MLSIGKFAAAGKVSVETIRFYQRKGLLTVPAQTGGMRRYGKEDLQQLQFIRKAQIAGFTLEEIKELIALEATNDRRKVRILAQSRLKALEIKINELQAAHTALNRLATACSKSNRGPCPILKAFGVED